MFSGDLAARPSIPCAGAAARHSPPVLLEQLHIYFNAAKHRTMRERSVSMDINYNHHFAGCIP